MSGPKISKAELEARKQRQLAEEKRRKADIIFEIKSNENRFIHSNIEINDYEIHEKLNKKFLEIKEKYYKKLEKLSKKATSKRKVQDLEDIRKNFENILFGVTYKPFIYEFFCLFVVHTIQFISVIV